jgi:alcohol dehydrogenase YqhD (iron-dependent ADH family)
MVQYSHRVWGTHEGTQHSPIIKMIKMCLNETYSKVSIRKHLSDNFPIQNGLKQGDPLLLLLFSFAV